ncbi:MAG TPA: hypothetical protein VKV15_11430 [Bryobacteraceae bacterium]|nr:hypothetical protein [Bryobacteraceae bacterium]
MLTWLYFFLGIAAAAAGLGLIGVSVVAGNAKILSVLFLVMSLATLIAGTTRRA